MKSRQTSHQEGVGLISKYVADPIKISFKCSNVFKRFIFAVDAAAHIVVEYSRYVNQVVSGTELLMIGVAILG